MEQIGQMAGLISIHKTLTINYCKKIEAEKGLLLTLSLFYCIDYLTMKSIPKILLLLIALIYVAGCKQSNSVNLNAKESKDLLRKLIPYSAKLPKGYNYLNRFDPKLDRFYNDELNNYKIEKYYSSDKDSFNYFLISRPAPSLYGKRIGIAGKFKQDAKGNVVNYEEAFWTYKMKEEEFDKKVPVLFKSYVEGKDLSQYKLTEEEWIEFPDKNCFYDKKEQQWKTM